MDELVYEVGSVILLMVGAIIWAVHDSKSDEGVLRLENKVESISSCDDPLCICRQRPGSKCDHRWEGGA